MPTRRELLRSTVALAGGALLGGVPPFVARRFAPPNVLLICIDTLRADRMGYAGCARELTPVMDSLARRGVAFSDVTAASSWTKTSVASIITGLDCFRHGVIDVENSLHRDVETIATIFQGKGYLTFCQQTNALMGIGRQGFRKGFDVFEYQSVSRARLAAGERYVPGMEVAARFEKGASILREAGRPFFGYVHLMDVHGPYLPPDEYRGLFSREGETGPSDEQLNKLLDEKIKVDPVYSRGVAREVRTRIEDLYDGSVRYADDVVGRMLGTLKVHGLLDGTVVVICSDHGEEFWEHGWTTHAKTLYGEVLSVPLVMAGADLPWGVTVEKPVRHVDILPTLLEVLGLSWGGGFDGQSAAGLATGEASFEAGVSLSALGKVGGMESRSIRTAPGRLKFIVNDYREPADYELYDLARDPGGQENLAESRGDIVGPLARWLDELQAAGQAETAKGKLVEVTDEMREGLRALGYLN